MKKLLDDLRSDEGWREYAYDDETGAAVACSGWVTIGYGFLVDARKGVGLPRAVGDFWLEYAAEERWQQLVASIPWIMEQPDDVQRALGNMAYQLGVRGVLNFRLMLAALEAGDRSRAATEALDSTWALQTPGRSQRVAKLIRGDT